MRTYALTRWIARGIVAAFFKETIVVGIERIPVSGPVIFVCNHNNKFVDGTVVMAAIPRPLRFLIATVSLSLKLVGRLARLAGALGVNRSQDMKYPGLGRIVSMTPAELYSFERPRRVGVRLSADLTVDNNQQFASCQQIVSKADYGPSATVLSGDSVTRFPLDCKVGDRLKIDGCTTLGTVIDVIDDHTLVVKETLSAEALDLGRSGETKAVLRAVAMDGTDSTKQTTSDDTQEEECSSKILKRGFTVFPKVDQGEVYEAVVEALEQGDSICIFPEGGSHDQPRLLPLKPGVAIMALTASVMGVEDVMIVPLGIHYYERHKFGSRAVIEVGEPQMIDECLLELYTGGHKREAVDTLMTRIKESMIDCMISAPEYDTLKAIQLSASLYPPERLRLTSEKLHQLYALFGHLFHYFEEDPATQQLKQAVLEYAQTLEANGLEDHEVQAMKLTAEGAFLKLIELTFIVTVILAIIMPPMILMSPIRLVLHWMTERHRREATANSSVKIYGDDVIASYKIAWLMVATPVMLFLTGLGIGIGFFPSPLGITLCIAASFLILPIPIYHSLQLQTKVVPLLKQIRCCYRVISSELDFWRDGEREAIFDRIELQLRVRKHVKSILHDGIILRAMSSHNLRSSNSSPNLADQDSARNKKLRELQTDLERIIPLVILEADTKRLLRAQSRYVPVVYSSVMSREEIL